MKGENLKWAYSFYLLTITIAWASITLWIMVEL